MAVSTAGASRLARSGATTASTRCGSAASSPRPARRSRSCSMCRPSWRAAFAYKAGQFLTFRLTIDGRHAAAVVLDVVLPRGRRRAAGDGQAGGRRASSRTGSPTRSPRVTCSNPPARPASSAWAPGRRHHRLRRRQRHHADLLAAEDGPRRRPSAGSACCTPTATARAPIFAGRTRRARRTLPGAADVVHHFDVEAGFVEARRRSGATSKGSRDLKSSSAGRPVHGPGRGDAARAAASARSASTSNGSRPLTRFRAASRRRPAKRGRRPHAGRDRAGRPGHTTAAHRPGTTILQTARQMGLTPPSSCEAGDCATCMGQLLEGSAHDARQQRADRRRSAEGWILTCQAVPDPPAVQVVYGYEED